IGERAEQERFGHTDFHYRADTLAAYASDEAESRPILMLRDAGEAVAYLRINLPHSANTHTVHAEAVLLPGRDPGLLLDALWPPFLELCQRESRTALTWWEYSGQDNPSLPAATGSGAVEATAMAEWLQSHDFTLDQVELISTLHLPAEVGKGDVDKHYEVVTWEGPTPEHLLEPMARLRGRMATDAPHGSREAEEEVWDAARIRREEARARDSHRVVLWAVALNESGEPVGYTFVECPERQPEIAYQADTLVRAEDRGHGLGLALKRANALQLQTVRPQVKRLHTWNAEENRWMLGINRALGFVTSSAMGAWQRTLDASTEAPSP
ncbi:hypothetical protein, partial [Corynebacterium sp.]|uniref:hypothetical protein n=1 Tax=Corynebacterium sp. TaxID=1720 RepID=UPI0026E08A32